MATDPAKVETTRRAVEAALDWRSSPETRQSATSFLESLKAGEVHELASIGYALIGSDWSTEVRLQGFKMLQHVIRLRWEELNMDEKKNVMELTVFILQNVANPNEQWALKSQAATLVAEVSRREGPSVWMGMLLKLFTLSEGGPIHAELVAMVLRWLPEDVTVHNEDLEGERRKQLLFGLTQTLSATLPFLYKLLHEHFFIAVELSHKNQVDLAKQHATAVTASLYAVVAYAEWAPVTELVKYHLVDACVYFQSFPEFRLISCEVLKLTASRRKPSDETSVLYISAMVHVFEALSQVSEAYLERIGAGKPFTPGHEHVDEMEVEYGECLCEAMVALGSQNLHCIADDEKKLDAYLRQMLNFLQLRSYALHSQALPLWLTLLRDSVTAVVVRGEPDNTATNQNEKEKKNIIVVIPENICGILLDSAFQWLLVKGHENFSGGRNEDESWTQELSATGDFSQYRGRLLELIRLIATLRPLLAVSMISQHINSALKIAHSQPSPQELSTLESSQIMLETILNGIPDTVLASDGLQADLISVFEGILRSLLTISWNSPSLVELQGRFLEAMGPCLKHMPGVVPVVVEKLFALLTSLPTIPRDANVGGSAKDTHRTRLQVCTSFLRVAKAADSALLQHMQFIADKMTNLQQLGLLFRGEMNLLGEALIIVGSAGGTLQQSQVLDWLLDPLRKNWEQPAWQQHYLSSPRGLVNMLSGRESIFGGTSGHTGEPMNEEVWSVFHAVTFFERAFRRSGDFKKAKSHPVFVESSAEDMDSSIMTEASPLTAHLDWMLPPLLKLLRCVHALWSDSIVSTLPVEVQGALAMSLAEQTTLLGGAGSKGCVAASASDGIRMESSLAGIDDREQEIRTWLKGVRDSGYNVLGLAAARVGSVFFNDIDGRPAAVCTALLENISFMEMHHTRQLIRSVFLNFVKCCPRIQWASWLGILLPPLLVHCHSALAASWATLLRDGAVKPSGTWAFRGATDTNDGSPNAIKTEVIQEKLLRDLTRETCCLLALIASPSLSPRQQSSSEQQTGADASHFIGPESMLGFLMELSVAKSAALRIGIDALEWPDSEAVHKVVAFCGNVVCLSTVFSDPQLQEIVGHNMFTAAIRGLTLESNSTAQAVLLGLLREIYIRLSINSQHPRQVLLSLPFVTPEVLVAFEKALGKTSSVKEQRQQIKSLLLTGGGDHLKALKAQKNTNLITNVTDRSVLGHRGAVPPILERSESFGLTWIM